MPKLLDPIAKAKMLQELEIVSVSKHQITEEMLSLAHDLSRIHGRIRVCQESSGIHFYMASPIALMEDGAVELDKCHLAVNITKYIQSDSQSRVGYLLRHALPLVIPEWVFGPSLNCDNSVGGVEKGAFFLGIQQKSGEHSEDANFRFLSIFGLSKLVLVLIWNDLRKKNRGGKCLAGGGKFPSFATFGKSRLSLTLNSAKIPAKCPLEHRWNRLGEYGFLEKSEQIADFLAGFSDFCCNGTGNFAEARIRRIGFSGVFWFPNL